MYVFAFEIPPHKIALTHGSSPDLRAKHCHVNMAVASISPEEPVEVAQIAPQPIALLCELDFLDSPADKIWQRDVDVEYGYLV